MWSLSDNTIFDPKTATVYRLSEEKSVYFTGSNASDNELGGLVVTLPASRVLWGYLLTECGYSVADMIGAVSKAFEE